MEVFIPNTKEQYSISDKGIVYSNYRYRRNGKKYLQKRIIIKRDHNNVTGKSLNTSVVSLFVNKKTHLFLVNSLMVKLFKIKKPDNYHYYDTVVKNGDVFNNGINNIGFRIRMEKASNYPFYPQPFYNQKNRITHKICGNCGNKKRIKCFVFSSGKESGNHKTYRNICEHCRSSKQWGAIKSNPERLERRKKNQDNWNNSEKGKKYWKEKGKTRNKYDYENVTPHYISNVLHFSELRLTQKDITPQLYQVTRKRILLSRTIKQLKLKLQEDETR